MKDKIITIAFIIIICGMFLVNLFVKDTEISTLERRKLAQFPEITLERIVNRKWIDDFENYTQDQFFGRDIFMDIKSFWSLNIFRQKDDNKMFVKDNAIYKMEYPLNTNNLLKNIGKIKGVCDKHLKDNKIYFSIIPEKNYYLENNDYLLMDYEKIENMMKDNLKDLEYINIFDELRLEDYYKTDVHWKQENLLSVANKISTSMGNDSLLNINYKKEQKGKFYGTYYGQINTDVEPDDIYILTNDVVDECVTYNFETQKEGKIYDEKETKDKYDIYLSGATPLISIINESATTEKELIIFRDSFGSSLAPLLVANYKKVTLVDLRYINNDLLDKFINFKNQEVFFIYSSLILNQNVLK